MEANATGHWRKVLAQLSNDELFQLAEQVEQITALPGWERIVAYIANGHQAVVTSLTSGPTRDHASQSRTLGYLAGLEEAPSVVKAIADAASSRREKLESAAVADRVAREERA